MSVSAYGAPHWFLAWKALSWMTASAPEAVEIFFDLGDPNETFVFPCAGDAAACPACGLVHPGRVCVDLANSCEFTRLRRLYIDQGDDCALCVDLAGMSVLARGATTAWVRERLEAWQALEWTPIGDP